MADTTSDSLQIVTQTIGGNDDTWGTINNANFTKTETAIAGLLQLSLTGGTETLTADQNRNAIIEVSGTLASNQTIEVTAATKWWHVRNATSGSFSLTVKTSAGTGTTVPQGGSAMVYCDGTNVILLNDTDRVDGLGTVVDNRVVRTNGTDGTALQQTGITVDDNDDMSGGRDLTITRDATIGGDAAVTGDVSAATATISGVTGKDATSGLVIPAGTTAERDGTQNQIRINTDLNQFEGYYNGAWHVISVSSNPLAAPQGYLTLVSGAKMPTADQSAKTAVYYTPDTGLQAPIHNGLTGLVTRSLSGELTLTLAAQHIANSIYDVYLDDNSGGAVRIGTGPAWSTVTAGSGSRGTGAGTAEITTLQGHRVNAEEITVRNGASTWTVAANQGTVIGTIYIDGTNGQVSCLPEIGQARKWGLSNLPHCRRPITLQEADSTSSWTTATSSFRASRNDTNNKITAFDGFADSRIVYEFQQRVRQGGSGSPQATIGIGIESTSTNSGSEVATQLSTVPVDGVVFSRAISQPITGVSVATALEKTSGVTTDFRGNTGMTFTASFMA